MEPFGEDLEVVKREVRDAKNWKKGVRKS